MESKPEKYPEFYELFDAADTTSMACEDFVEYSKSLQRKQDDYEGVLYYGEEKRKEGIKEGTKKTIASFVNRLRGQGMSASQISAMLGLSNEEIEAIPSV